MGKKQAKKRPNTASQSSRPPKRPKFSSQKLSTSTLIKGAGGGREREEEEDFPRGGQGVLSALEKREIRDQAMNEHTLFREGGGGTSVRSETSEGSTTAAKGVHRKAPVGKAGPPGSRKRVDTLTPKSLTTGVLVLGAVQEIGELEVTVSLPSNMCGVVAISNVSDSLTAEVEEEIEEREEEEEEGERVALSSLSRLFFVGQLVVCCVLSEVGKGRGEGRGKGRVELTVNPRVVNSHLSSRDVMDGMVLPGWVKSVEDHGYIIDFCIGGKMGFLLKKNAAEFIKTCNKGKPLVRGQVTRFKVLSAVEARSVPVSVDLGVVGGALVGGDSLVQMHALQPGMLVNTAVKEVAGNGVVVTFLGGFEGSVGLRHLPTWNTSPDSLPPKKKYKGRLLWVDVEGKKVGVTLQRTLVEGQSTSFSGVEYGDVFDDVEIVKVYPDSALLLSLDSTHLGYSPLPLVYDERQEKLSREHRVGSRHSCRVVQFNLIDGAAIVSLQPSVLAQRYVRYADIAVGDVLDGTVERHGSYGTIIAIQGNIRGLCPATHISDGRLKQPQRKYPEGKTVRCRVLQVSAEERRVLLTCKRSLVALQESEVLSEYTQAAVGRVFRGVVSRVRERGFTVFFFNNVMGYVPQSEMGGASVTFPVPSSVVQPGQLVECRVLECVPEKKLLRLSLRLDSEAALDVSPDDQLRPGMVVSGEVTGVSESGLSVCYTKTGEIGYLPTQHLSDYPAFCVRVLSQHQHSLEAAVKEGRPYELSEVLVVCGRQSTRPALLSLKPSLHLSLGQGWASEYSELQPEQLLTGFIRKVMPYGCFVEFPHNLSALAPTKYLQDEFTSDPSLVYREGQTVFAKVLEVREDKKRFLVSLRPSDVRLLGQSGGTEGEEGRRRRRRERLGERLEQYLAERERVMANHLHHTGNLSPGTLIHGKVYSLEETEVGVELEGRLVGAAAVHTATELEVEVGSEVVCCVLGVEGEVVRVSLDPALVEGCRRGEGEKGRRKKRKSSSHQPVLQVNDTLVGTVEHITPNYLVVAVTTTGDTIPAYAAMDSGQLGVLSLPYKHLKVGQKVTTTVYSVTSLVRGEQTGPPIVVVTSTRATGSKHMLGDLSKPFYMDVSPGDVIDVIVKSIKTAYLSVRYHLWQGRVHCCLATDNPQPGHTPFAKVHPGDVVRARVVRVRKREIRHLASKKGAAISTLELTTMESLLEAGVGVNAEQLLRTKFSDGEEVFGFVNEVTEKGISVHLSPKALGFIPLMLAHKDPSVLWSLKRHFAEGEAVKCTVVSERKKSNQIIVSLISRVATPSVGSIMECLVHETTPLSLVVSAPWWAGFGRVDITDVVDEYTENPLKLFRDSKQLLRCCVVSVVGERLDLSLRPSRVCAAAPVGNPPDQEMTSLEDLPEGTVVRGYVKAVTNVGVFVRLGRGLDGRVQIKHLSDGFVKNYQKKFAVGQLVKAKVIRVKLPEGQVELSLRLSHTDPAAAKRERRKADRERGGEDGRERGGEGGRENGLKGSSDGESADNDSSEEEEEEEKGGEERPRLQLSGRGDFVWEREERGGERERDETGSEEEEEKKKEKVAPTKRSRRQKKAALKAEEEQLYQTERALLTSQAPENVEDYERLVLSQPNSSAVWVQYMSFLLQTAEVDKARAVGERALQAISFREEGEKLNVWVARLNLENLYGSQESLAKVFQAALQQNDRLEMFRRLAAIYQDSNKMALAEQLYQTMTKQFRSELSVWTEFGLFLMRRGKVETARRILPQCLRALTLKQQHVEAISKFAQWEFKYGDSARGGTMFESLVASYPRRTDLWCVYVDMLVRAGQIDQAREVLERAVHLKLSPKKMKQMFKRYLEFEKKHGSPAGVEVVKDKARTYVEAKMAQ